MKANELMIHNYVSFEGHPVCITKIGLTGIEGYLYKNDTLYDVKLKYEDIEPIPITDKLLMKNGFEFRALFYYEDIHDTACRFEKVRTNGSSILIRKPMVSEDGSTIWEMENVRIKLDYVHQLQNLCNIAGLDIGIDIDKI